MQATRTPNRDLTLNHRQLAERFQDASSKRRARASAWNQGASIFVTSWEFFMNLCVKFLTDCLNAPKDFL